MTAKRAVNAEVNFPRIVEVKFPTFNGGDQPQANQSVFFVGGRPGRRF
jgi:hypothetical protein